jgi:hypothetical protein
MTDEGPRRDTTLGKMAQLPPLRAGWELTAATASQISDGSAAVLIASSAAVRRHGFTPRARIRALAVTGSDPVYMLTGPIPATEKALEKGHLSVDDIDVFEVNEAFAPVVIAWPGTPGPRWPRPTRMAAPSRLAIRWGHRRHPDDEDAARARALGRPLWPADHVRGGRSGQRQHHRAGGLAASGVSPDNVAPRGRRTSARARLTTSGAVGRRALALSIKEAAGLENGGRPG